MSPLWALVLLPGKQRCNYLLGLLKGLHKTGSLSTWKGLQASCLLKHEHSIHMKSQKWCPKIVFVRVLDEQKRFLFPVEASGIKVFSLLYIFSFQATSLKQSLCWVTFSSHLQARNSILLPPLSVLIPLSPAFYKKKVQHATSSKILTMEIVISIMQIVFPKQWFNI